ncbi:MAG: hypothetical protein HY075_12735 [Deltaproteobacteria bacterium]|nr:hypothetical protein [Deltaproteobacteria bacterium]
MLTFLLSTVVFASGMAPTCNFSTAKDHSIFGGARYDVAAAFRAADLAIVGEPGEVDDKGSQRVRIRTVLRGDEHLKDIGLIPQVCHGTACTGLRFSPKREFVFLLAGGFTGRIFGKVDGNGNDACPNVFEVDKGVASVGPNKVPLAELKKFFEGLPAPIPFP